MTKDKIKRDCPSCLAFGKHCPHKVNGDPYYYNCTMTVEALEKENCELLGLIQAKDKLIEKLGIKYYRKSIRKATWCRIIRDFHFF